MNLIDMFFGTDVFNRTGRKNIRGDELADLIAQSSGAAMIRGARAARASSTTLTTGVPTILQFDQEFFDDANFVDVGGAPTRFTIPSLTPALTRGVINYYSINAQNATGEREAILLKNGIADFVSESGTEPGAMTALSQARLTFNSGIIEVTAGDFFEFQFTQNSGGNLSLFRWQASIMCW